MTVNGKRIAVLEAYVERERERTRTEKAKVKMERDRVKVLRGALDAANKKRRELAAEMLAQRAELDAWRTQAGNWREEAEGRGAALRDCGASGGGQVPCLKCIACLTTMHAGAQEVARRRDAENTRLSAQVAALEAKLAAATRRGPVRPCPVCKAGSAKDCAQAQGFGPIFSCSCLCHEASPASDKNTDCKLPEGMCARDLDEDCAAPDGDVHRCVEEDCPLKGKRTDGRGTVLRSGALELPK